MALAKALLDGLVKQDFVSTEEMYLSALAIIDNQSKHGEAVVQAAIKEAVAIGHRKLTAYGAASDRQVRRHKAAVRSIIENQAARAR